MHSTEKESREREKCYFKLLEVVILRKDLDKQSRKVVGNL